MTLSKNQPKSGAQRSVSENPTKRTGRPDGMGQDERGYEHIPSANPTDRTRPDINSERLRGRVQPLEGQGGTDAERIGDNVFPIE